MKFSPGALRGLERLPSGVAAAVVQFATATLPQDPIRMSKPLRGDLDGLRTARRGDYRVLFSLDQEAEMVTIVRVAHRSDAYRP
jgi:mRNA-degrading endonuclease RelE of RelBE toxin-antitoxin system